MKEGPVGIFDVYVDESVIYSNRKEGGRLPKNDEIVQRIRDYQARPAPQTKGRRNLGKEAPVQSGGQCGCG